MSTTTEELNLKLELHIRVFCGFTEVESYEIWESWPLWTYVTEIRNTGTYLEASDMDEDRAAKLTELAADHHHLCMTLSEMCNLRPQWAPKYIHSSQHEMAKLEHRAKLLFGDKLTYQPIATTTPVSRDPKG